MSKERLYTSARNYWSSEYLKNGRYSSTTSLSRPSHIYHFEEILRKRRIFREGWDILEIACGNGRNCFYIHDTWNPKTVLGVDYCTEALDICEKKKGERRLGKDISFLNADLRKLLPVKSNSVDIAVDIFGSMHLREKHRLILIEELHRIVRPGGYILIHVLSSETDYVMKPINGEPGPEPDSMVFEGVNFEKYFSKKELRDAYHEFVSEVIERNEKRVAIFGVKNVLEVGYSCVFRVP